MDQTTQFAQFRGAHLKDGARVITQDAIKDTKSLADVVSFEMKSAGRDESQFDIAKNLEHKSQIVESKANEIMHTTNTGLGAELVPGAILQTDFIDLIPQASQIMNFFQSGFHGKNLPKIADVAVLQELALHQLKTEQTTGAFAIAQGKGLLATKKVTLTQKQRFFSVDISEYEQQFAILDVVALIKRKMALSSANTMVSDVLNGDTVLTANTNINLIDGTPAGTESYTGANGLRKQAITDSTATDAGALDFADYITMIQKLGYLGANKSDLLFIHSLIAEVKALNISEFKSAYLSGQLSSAITGKLPNFLGASYTTDRFMPETDATGKVSATGSNNTKGEIVCCHRSAVQWGTNGDYYMEVWRVPGSGYQVIGWYFSAHAIAGLTELGCASVSSAYNLS